MPDSKNPKQKLALAGTALLLAGGLGFFFLKGHGPTSLHRDTASLGSSATSESIPVDHPPGNTGSAATPTGPEAHTASNTDIGGSGTLPASGTLPTSTVAGVAGGTGVTSPALLGGTQIAMIDKTVTGSVPANNLGSDGKTTDPKTAADPKMVVAPAKPVEPEPACYTVTYTHKAAAGHKNMDECSQHRNLIKLGDSKVSLKSVCVRVDGTPVKFDWVKSSILLGPVAGPNTKISVRYCQPKAKDTCADDCKLPKDDFMAALGGDDEKIAKHQAKNGKMAKWDPSDAQEDSDVAAQVDSEMQKELADGIDLATFEGWKDSAPAQVCSRSVAGTSATAPVATAHK